MPIKSYLAHPHSGQKETLIQALQNIRECEVIPAKNEDLLIVVTETENKDQEEKLTQRMEALAGMKLLAMVSGFDTQKND
ncbi:hypothetical protein FUAX_19570 [Fulvitalea axinellae]|uniref:Periplasmic nitrate reductase chaperone NapD n=1 Tax=Fulvitalea axinellae TaxID=1182444 RepID=A0AAU9DAY1_9BACT|nr:hypothetical protein FUAX_19570 [Fulvitalea axinellae]